MDMEHGFRTTTVSSRFYFIGGELGLLLCTVFCCFLLGRSNLLGMGNPAALAFWLYRIAVWASKM